MTHAEHYSTSEPGADCRANRRSHFRTGVLLTVATITGLASLVGVSTHTASATTLSDAQSQAAALGAKLNAEQSQILILNSQSSAADYRLSQLTSRIASTKVQMAADQAVVNRDEAQLRHQAVADYMNNGTSSQLTQMFAGNNTAAGIRNEYAAISTSNVTNTVDSLHSAQSQLHAQQATLQVQQQQASTEASSLASSKGQAVQLASEYQSQKSSADAQVQSILQQQQAAAEAAALAAANAKLVAAKQAQAAASAAAAQSAANTPPRGTTPTGSTSGSGTSAPSQSGGGASGGSANAASYTPPVVNQPPPPVGTIQQIAVSAAQSQLGVEYTWGGTSPSTGFDCSGLVMWAYAHAGVSLPHYSGAQYSDTTQIPLADIAPGDLLFYGPGGSEHVAMYIGGGMMVEAPETGQTVHDTPIRTGSGFVGVGRVN